MKKIAVVQPVEVLGPSTHRKFQVILAEIAKLEEKLAQVVLELETIPCKNCTHTLNQHWSESNRTPGECFMGSSTTKSEWCECSGFKEK